MRTLMVCGCVAYAQNMDGTPYCIIHNTSEVAKEIPDLTGRIAKCEFCKKERPSSYNLPCFTSRPNEDYDEYYCGCIGWD